MNGGLMGKSSINGPFSMAMLNNQRVNGDFERYPIFSDRPFSIWITKNAY